MKSKIKTAYQERFLQNNQTIYNSTELSRPPIDGFRRFQSILYGTRHFETRSRVLSLALNRPITFQQEPHRTVRSIENSFSRVHQRPSFDDNLLMLTLIDILNREKKRFIATIDTNGFFYAIALETLKKVSRIFNCSALKC